jgi:hypothetical protein
MGTTSKKEDADINAGKQTITTLPGEAAHEKRTKTLTTFLSR